MENEELNEKREQKNKKTSYVLLVVFGVLLILGVVLLICGLNKHVDSGSSDITDLVTKILLVASGGILTLGAGIFMILTIVMMTTKFKGKSRNPINNFFKDSVSEVQDMFSETGDMLAPKRRGKKICKQCGFENDKDETICTRCGGGLGE